VRGGKDLHIKRDGTTTIEGIPVAEFFAPGKKPAVSRDESASDAYSNIFRLEDGCWRLKFGGFEVLREPYSVGLHYCHELLKRQPSDVAASRLVLLVNGEPVDIMDEKDLLEGDVATEEPQSPGDGDDVVPKVVTEEFYDEIMSDEDRDRIWESVAALEDKSMEFKAKGAVIDAAASQEEAMQLRAYLEKHAPKTDGAYFPNRTRQDRNSVGNAIWRAVERLEKSHPPLAAHLSQIPAFTPLPVEETGNQDLT